MALTTRWLTVGEAALRLRRPEQEVLRLAISQTIHSRLAGDHWELCTAAVEEYADETASELAASRGEVLADTAGRPAWEAWTAAEDPTAFNDRADYSNPNDEGDDQQ